MGPARLRSPDLGSFDDLARASSRHIGYAGGASACRELAPAAGVGCDNRSFDAFTDEAMKR